MSPRISLLLILWVCLPGCGAKGPAIGSLRGQVRLDGKPLPACMVLFENGEAGVSMWAPVDAEGKYVARTHDTPGLPVGTYRVAVKPHQAWNVDPKTGLPALVAQGKKELPPPIPARFFSGETSGLSVDVKEGENPPFDVELTGR